MKREDYARKLDVMVDEHQARIDRALVALENEVADGISELPTRDGRLFDLAAAVNQRVRITRSMDDRVIREFEQLVEEYDQIGVDFRAVVQEAGEFTGGFEADRNIERQLRNMAFEGFEDVAYTFRDTIADELYQSTLTGRRMQDSIRNIRQHINGVYIQSDDEEIERLVEIAKGDDEEAAERAASRLRTVYAADRAGNNLRRYAYQIAQDSIMQHSARIAMKTAEKVGADRFQYFGDIIGDSRPWCIQHANRTMTRAAIEELWSENNWKGKAPGDPFIVRGGYNCRHHWVPVLPDDDEIDVDDLLGGKIPDPTPLTTPANVGPVQVKWQHFSGTKSQKPEVVNKILEDIEDPGVRARLGKVNQFVEDKDIRFLFMTQAQQNTKNAAARNIESQVEDFLTKDRKPTAQKDWSEYGRYNYARPGGMKNALGWTFWTGNHTIQKLRPGLKLNGKTDTKRVGNDILASARKINAERGINEYWSTSIAAEGRASEEAQIVTTLLHELGHQVHYWNETPAPPSVESTTQYGKTNKMEWHAEQFVLWLLDRDGMDPVAAEHMDKIVETAIKSKKKDYIR